MNPALVAAVVSGLVSISAVFLSDLFGRRRDREGEWRKLKLEQYQEFTLALSNAVHRKVDDAAKRRYADAVNSLALIAPPEVLAALYAFQDETSYRNQDRSQSQYEQRLSTLFREMRRDCQPKPPKDSSDAIFRTMDIPPDDA